jgi:hypothetical protein
MIDNMIDNLDYFRHQLYENIQSQLVGGYMDVVDHVFDDHDKQRAIGAIDNTCPSAPFDLCLESGCVKRYRPTFNRGV